MSNTFFIQTDTYLTRNVCRSKGGEKGHYMGILAKEQD